MGWFNRIRTIWYVFRGKPTIFNCTFIYDEESVIHLQSTETVHITGCYFETLGKVLVGIRLGNLQCVKDGLGGNNDKDYM